MTQPTLDEINRLDIVDFLASQSYHPAKIAGTSYWYISMLPARFETKPSFKVNRKKNKWIDFGYDAREHSLIDLGILLFQCTIRELVQRLSGQTVSPSSVSRSSFGTAADEIHKLQITKTYPLRSDYLLRYLWERRIPISVAQKFCEQVEYTFDGQKVYYAIGFQSGAGGYNIRNKYHKYSSSPKSPTYICNGSKDIAVFEGFFDMMTLLSLLKSPDHQLPDLLVLNGVTFFPGFTWLMDMYRTKHLFLDNDPAGDAPTKTAIARKCGYIDHRPLYQGYQDLNHWACGIGSRPQMKSIDLNPSTPASDP